MGEKLPSIEIVKQRLLEIRAKTDSALREIEGAEEIRSAKWKCSACAHLKHFTKTVAVVACGNCPRCKASSFLPVD